MFKGFYNGSETAAHPADLEKVLSRAQSIGVEKIMVTGGSLEECKEARQLCLKHENLFFTVGVHPTRCNEFLKEEEKYLQELLLLIEEDQKTSKKCVAIGEFGLDYDRTQFCSKEVQQKYFEKQFELAEKTGLPLFLHMRGAASDFCEIVKRNRHKFKKGVVHSFTGTIEDAKSILELDLLIGINGCSLKTDENLKVVDFLPLKSICIETDCPWCDIRASHAGFKHVKTSWLTKDKKKWDGGCIKGRTEPCHIMQVCEVIAGVKSISVSEVSSIVYKNTCGVYFPQIE